MATPLTFEVPIVPVPEPTLQVAPVGCVRTLTAYAPPSATGVGKVKVASPAAGATVSPPLASTRPAEGSPVIMPPSECEAAAHAIATCVTLAPATVPVEFVMLQCSPAGCAFTVTA